MAFVSSSFVVDQLRYQDMRYMIYACVIYDYDMHVFWGWVMI
ncbi:hypothetical protein ES319_D06G169500v1 [Gossypium barbadense]|uniref:Uncharacterized protein n=1 Tax=Gossypium barbadense TaxID=3634 RepID=A0A5J5R2T2_GOSBA|nr:hypothetical protein ES319_D06G169500v1 [Gossypium barbadense]